MRCVRIIAAVMALLVTTAAGAAGTGDAAAVRPGVNCTPGGDLVTQAQNGRIDTCLRLGNLAPGAHTISLQDVLVYGPTPTKPGVKRRVKLPPTPSEPVVALSLSPASGPPERSSRLPAG